DKPAVECRVEEAFKTPPFSFNSKVVLGHCLLALLMQSSGRINCAFKKAEPRDINPSLCQCGIDFSVLHALHLPAARGPPSEASSVRPSFQHRARTSESETR